MMTTVSSGGYLTSLNSEDASAAMNDALETPFRVALVFAELIDPSATSMPTDEEKSEERVTVNRPDPQ